MHQTFFDLKRYASKHSPMLFAAADKACDSSHIFFNTTQGWLLTRSYGCYGSTGLTNPLSGSFIPLPRLPITKTVASCNPLDPNCIVLAITNCYELVFCNPYKEPWREFGIISGNCSDIIYYNKNFYVLQMEGEVLLCDLSPKPKVINFAPSTELYGYSHLVESSGDLLQVNRYAEHFQGKFVYLFKVIKLDFNAWNWIPVTTLGENSLLWSSDQCPSVSSKDFPEFKSNCIYFVQEMDGSYILRTFDLKTWRYETILKLSETISSYHWFTPDVTLGSHANEIDQPPRFTNSNFPL